MSVRQPGPKHNFTAERQALRSLCAQSRPLIAELNKRWPATMPDPGEDPAVMWSRIGGRRLVEFLNTMLAEADDDAGGPFRVTDQAQIVLNNFNR